MNAVFDVDLVRSRRKRALKDTHAGADFLMRRIADDLADRLAPVERHFDRAAMLFCGTRHAAEAVRASGKVGEVLRVETDRAFLSGQDGIVAEPETVPLEPQSVDLAVSLLALHDVNDVPGMLVQTHRALRPDGLFLAAMAGQGTLAELRDALLAAETDLYGGASPRVSPFTDVRDAGALLQRAGFALPVADIDTVTVRYGSVFELMRDLRAMGATSALAARPRKPVSRGFFRRVAEIYAERHADPDGRIRATFAIVWMSGWTPHESQQKPLRPGSATVSLEKLLGKGDS